MSAILAGFAQAYTDSEVKKKEDAADLVKLEKQYEHETKLKQVTLYEEQKRKDAELAKQVDAFMGMAGVDPTQRPYYAQAIESMGMNSVVDLHSSGQLNFDNGLGGMPGAPSNASHINLVEIEEAPVQIHEYLTSTHGVAPHIASGLVGNMMQESGPRINFAAVGDNGNAFGSVQWNGDRRHKYLAYAKSKGVAPTDWKTQADYMMWEFQNPEKKAWDSVTKTNTAEEAALVASQMFWRPGTPHNERRVRYAASVQAKMSDLASQTSTYHFGQPMEQGAAPEAEAVTPGTARQTELSFGAAAGNPRQGAFQVQRQTDATSPVQRAGEASLPGVPAPTGQDGWQAPVLDENTPAALRPRAPRAVQGTGRPGLRITPKGTDLTALAGKDPALMEQWIVANDSKLSDGDHARALEMVSMARTQASNPEYWRNPETLLGMDATQLGAAVKMTNDPEARDTIQRALNARLAVEDDEELRTVNNVGELVGQPLSTLIQHQAVHGPNMDPAEAERLGTLITATRATEGKQRYWEDATQMGAMDVDTLRAVAASETDPAGLAAIDRALAARDNNSSWFGEELGKAISLDRLIALRGNIQYRKGLSPAERIELTRAVDDQQRIFMDREATRKAQEGGTMLYLPLTDAGTASYGEQIQVRVGPDGSYVNAIDNSPVDATKGRIIDPATAEQFEKLYNTPVIELGQSVAAGANAVRDLVKVRQLVINNPASVNRYISVASSLIGEAEAMGAGFTAMVKNGAYDLGFENEMLDDIRGLSEADRLVAQGMLQAAYAVASSRGSSGQALSDRELTQNLEALGANQTDPRKIVPLLNSQISSLVSEVETNRSTTLQSLLTQETLRNSLSDTPVGTNFRDFAASQMGEYEQGYQEALQDRRDYSFSVPGRGAPTQPAPQQGADTQSLMDAYNRGETITVTPELAAKYPSLQSRIGRAIIKPQTTQ